MATERMISTSARLKTAKMRIELISRAILGEGGDILLTVELREGEKSERRKFTIPKKIFEKLELPVPPAEISRETLYEIMCAEEQYRAIKKAFDLLAYGRNSVRTLTAKLRSRGFDDDVAAEAAAYMQRNGYLKEKEDAEREAECCIHKMWGRRRILMHLHEKGYDGEALEAAKIYLDTIDFVELCVKLIRTKYGTLPKVESERQKVISGLIRFGYSFTEIKAAAKVVEHYELPGRL